MTLVAAICRRDSAYLWAVMSPRTGPGDSAEDGWELVTVGRSVARVRRSPDGLNYAKTASSVPAAAVLATKRDRLGTPVRRSAPRASWTGTIGPAHGLL
jgi:hypothetical protein